jgi:hypothetical protein
VNWDAIGAVAEAIGAVGVIASLLYLATQVRASTRASAVEAKLQSTRLLNEFIDDLIENPELNDLYLRGLADLESLSESDYYRFSNMALKAFWCLSRATFSTACEHCPTTTGTNSRRSFSTGFAGPVAARGGRNWGENRLAPSFEHTSSPRWLRWTLTNESLQRTIDGWVRLTLVALLQHTWVAESGLRAGERR